MVSCLMGDSTALASAIVRCCLKDEEIDIWFGVANIRFFGGNYNSLFSGTSPMGL